MKARIIYTSDFDKTRIEEINGLEGLLALQSAEKKELIIYTLLKPKEIFLVNGK